MSAVSAMANEGGIGGGRSSPPFTVFTVRAKQSSPLVPGTVTPEEVPAGVPAVAAANGLYFFLLLSAFLAEGACTTPPEANVDTPCLGVIEGGSWTGFAGTGRVMLGVDGTGFTVFLASGLVLRPSLPLRAEVGPSCSGEVRVI